MLIYYIFKNISNTGQTSQSLIADLGPCIIRLLAVAARVEAPDKSILKVL